MILLIILNYRRRILKYFQYVKRWKNYIALFVVSIFLRKKTLALFIISSKCKNEDEKLIMKEESIEVLKMVGLIEST